MNIRQNPVLAALPSPRVRFGATLRLGVPTALLDLAYDPLIPIDGVRAWVEQLRARDVRWWALTGTSRYDPDEAMVALDAAVSPWSPPKAKEKAAGDCGSAAACGGASTTPPHSQRTPALPFHRRAAAHPVLDAVDRETTLLALPSRISLLPPARGSHATGRGDPSVPTERRDRRIPEEDDPLHPSSQPPTAGGREPRSAGTGPSRPLVGASERH